MGLDITFKRVREIRCQHCSAVTAREEVDSESSIGRVWYDFLEKIGYYVPHEKRPVDFDDPWYGKDMVVPNEQLRSLLTMLPDCAYALTEIDNLICAAYTHGDSIAVNADW